MSKKIQQILKEWVIEAIREEKLANVYAHLAELDKAMQNTRHLYGDGETAEALAWPLAQLIVDNGLSVEDIENYPNLKERLDDTQLRQCIEEYMEQLRNEDEFYRNLK